jgi:hypothetical protein
MADSKAQDGALMQLDELNGRLVTLLYEAFKCVTVRGAAAYRTHADPRHTQVHLVRKQGSTWHPVLTIHVT